LDVSLSETTICPSQLFGNLELVATYMYLTSDMTFDMLLQATGAGGILQIGVPCLIIDKSATYAYICIHFILKVQYMQASLPRFSSTVVIKALNPYCLPI